jgi:hypothetical protein
MLGSGENVSVHVQLQDNAEVSAKLNPSQRGVPFMAIRLGDYPNSVSVFMTTEAAGSLAEQILRELSNESMRAAKMAEAAAT